MLVPGFKHSPKDLSGELVESDVYIYSTVGRTEELYDLTSDPNETRNLIGTADPSLVTRLR